MANRARPESGRPSRRRWATAVLAAAALAAAAAALRLVLVRPRFDSDAVARSEAAMWRAYYRGDRAAMSREAVALLRRRFGLPLPAAVAVTTRLAAAASAFRDARGGYEEAVLPELTEAYRLLAAAAGAGFDPAEAARAELAWWVARRTPGRNDPDQVGDLIGALYAVLAGADHPAFAEAGRLRARAARLRDEGGADTDWERVEELLRRSYRALAAAVERIGR